MHYVVTLEYISDLVITVSELGGRVHFRSAANRLYDIPQARTLIGSKAFLVWRSNGIEQTFQSFRGLAVQRHRTNYRRQFRQQPLLNAI